jgi:hypothetical protein
MGGMAYQAPFGNWLKKIINKFKKMTKIYSKND